MILTYDLDLDVPFQERGQARAMGAAPRYQGDKFLCWFVPKGVDVSPFSKWWNFEFRNLNAPASNENIQALTLSNIMSEVTEAVNSTFSNPVWVTAEITGITGSQHKYLELVDYSSQSSNPVKSRGIIFSSQSSLISKFEKETGMSLSSGMKIMFLANVEFSGQYGLSLRIIGLNSEYSLGQVEMNLKLIRDRLTKEGVYGANKALRPPMDFTRVAVIAPDGAAGLGDFMTQADVLKFHKLCQFDHYPATFQGVNAASSIVGAFESIYMNMQSGVEYDSIVVIRGGGDKAGLYALNEYAIAKALCLMPIPVMVGIGHERDDTILDELACIRFPTPSMVISHIAARIIGNMQEMRELELKLKKIAAEKCYLARMTIDRGESLLKENATRILHQAKRQIEQTESLVNDGSRRVIDKAKNEIRLLTQEIVFNSPQKILKKGYAIVKNEKGEAVGDGQKVGNSGSKISIQFRDVTVHAITE